MFDWLGELFDFVIFALDKSFYEMVEPAKIIISQSFYFSFKLNKKLALSLRK